MPIRNAPAPPINKKVKSVAEATIMAMNKMIEEKQLEYLTPAQFEQLTQRSK